MQNKKILMSSIFCLKLYMIFFSCIHLAIIYLYNSIDSDTLAHKNPSMLFYILFYSR